MLTFFLLVLFTDVSLGNNSTNNGETSTYFSTQIHNYSKKLLTDVIVELENGQQENNSIRKWTALHQELSNDADMPNLYGETELAGWYFNNQNYTGDMGSGKPGIAPDVVDACATISPMNRSTGTNSTTDGNTGRAICVGAFGVNNTWVDNDPRAIKFTISFPTSESGRLSGLEFFQQSPTTNHWYPEDIDVCNNPAQKFGFRVLKDNVEIHKSIDHLSSATWKFESFDFTGDSDFEYTNGATFLFEILAYDKNDLNCYNNIIGTEPVMWDLDDLKVLGRCGSSATGCYNKINNEEFDNGTNDWNFYVDGSTTGSATWSIDNTNQVAGTNAAYLNIANATGTSWDIQFSQNDKSIIAGKEYQVVYEAKAVAERRLVVSTQKNSIPWTSYGSQVVNLTTEPQTYSFKFIAPETNTGNVSIIFHVAESAENIYIDNVRFTEACETEICDNNIDDDGDGLIDNEDEDCSGSIACISCAGPNLFDNPSFETGTWTGSETFVTGVFATDLSSTSSNSLDSWGNGDSKWVESNKATDGNRFVYLNKDIGNPVCYGQRYTFGEGNEINDCDTYQVCFDWASFNNDYVNGRATNSQPSIDFIFKDNANQDIEFLNVPIGIPTANQSWNNLTWESLSFSFKFAGNLTAPPNTAYVDVLISEREGYDNGLILDNTSFCVVNSCSDDCSVTNMYPGFALDPVGDNCSWLDYTLDNDLNFTNNGDGTATIAGKIVDGIDADWDGGSCTASPCGVDDAWQLTLNLSNKQSWSELQAAGGTNNVHTNCNASNLDYWDVSGTLTGLGCNSGRTLTINSAASNYRLQIGYGGNSNDSNCEFGLSTWFEIEEGGTPMQADIYGFINESCYEGNNEICNNGIDDDLDGAIDNYDSDCPCLSQGIPNLNFNQDALGNNLVAGDDPSEAWAAWGIHIATSKPSSNPLMIFNSAAPSSDDFDLGSPNTDFGGPGIGDGGKTGRLGENSEPLGNILIVSDGNAADPDDVRGTIIFTFDNPLDIASLSILDIDYNSVTNVVRAYDNANNLLVEKPIYAYGDNSVIEIAIGASNVSRLEVISNTSFSVSALHFCDTDIPDNTIGDLIWEDINGDGNASGESGLDAVTVFLMNNTGDILAQTETDNTGFYSFSGLVDGVYEVFVQQPVGYSFTHDLDGNTDAYSGVFSVANGVIKSDVDFGLQVTSNPCATVASDVSGYWNKAHFGEGTPDGLTTRFGGVNAYVVITLENEIPAGTTYGLYLRGLGGAHGLDVFEAPEGTSLPNSQMNTPSGFTSNGTATGGNDVIIEVQKTTQVATKYIYLDQAGLGKVDFDAVVVGNICNGVCAIEFDNIAVSNCINQPLMDVATVDATISWTSAPANDILKVSIDNKTEYIDVAGGATAPQTIRFTIPADGSTGNVITAEWTNTVGCNQTTTYDAPSACSTNEITCDILYICGDDKPYDGDPWDHGWIEYLDAINGSKGITAVFSKPDASGMGLYDPNNINNLLTIDLNDYDLIIVSATTEDKLSTDLISNLATTPASVLNSNYKIVDDLGMSDYNASYTFQEFANTDGTTSETLYNFNNENPSYNPVILRGHYLSNAGVLLWRNGADYASGTDGVLFHNTSDDVLSGIASHGDRVFLGYHMNGVYANAENGGAIPTPDSLWFDPAKHLTLAGKMYLDSALVLAAANCGVASSTCCTQINYANNSLENGNFSSFTSSSNPNGTATLTTFGGSDAVDWNPSGGLGGNGSPITAFGANPGYWVDASTNGGLGALDGDRFYWLEPRNSVGGSDCIGAISGADLLGSFCAGDTLEICSAVAAYDPNNINSGSVSTDLKFEIYTNNGQDPADFITTPTGTTSVNDNGGNNESFTLPLPASTNIKDLTGATFTGVNGQVADWRTLNWQTVCFQVVLKEDQNNYSSIVFSIADNSDGMAIDNLSIRDITTPNAGRDTTVYTCSPRLNLGNAKSGEEWSKVTEPSGATATINTSTGVVAGLTENGIYKFLLSKTSDGICHDTIRVIVNCTAEICDDGIDNDGDGLTDCEDPDCKSISITDLSFSECVLTGSLYQSTMSVEVSWSNPPAGEGINVITPDNTEFIDIVGGATSPYTVQFVIAADNSTSPLTIAYTSGNSCGVDSYYDAPAPCPGGNERNKPCTNGSGYVGGVVFEDSSGDGLQDAGEPGLEGIMVTATDDLGATVGQTLTNNIGIFEFADLTDGDKLKLEFTAIPSGMYPTNGSTYKGTTVQYVDAPSCTTTLGLLNPITNACEATNTTILQNGYSVVACLPAGDDVTLAIKDITQLGTLWQTPANRNTNQYSNVPTIRMWETSDFEGEEIFSMAIDPRDGTIYAVASPLYGDGSNISSVLFEENIAPKVFKINPETGVVTRIAQLSGTLGLGAIDFDVINEQLLITNMDDGKIYRLNTDGVVLGSYDPLTVDDGISSQLPNLGDRVLGIAFNPIDKRVYYSVWSNHYNGSHQNVNNNYNTIRSVSLDANGDFIPSTDQLEIAVPYNPGHTVTLTAPTADIAFNRAGDRLLIGEFAVIENSSNGILSTSAHAGVVREFQKIAGVWTLEPTYGSNYQGKYDIGSLTNYRGRNSRGGVAWAYGGVSGNTIIGDDDFILATGDALHIASLDGDYIYGYQFTPATGGNIANSILVDLDNDLINADKYVYSDVDVYKNYCAALTLEVGNYVWLDANEDGVQDLYEVGLAGVNVTLFDAAGDSLTSVVTDANGAYYFNENISGFSGLTPNTTYYIVVGRGGQFNTTNSSLSFVFDLTIPNTGNGNYTDENDSDGVIGNPSYGHPITISGYPTIELTTGANGQNDYSFDFGFKEICSAAIAVNDSIPTCPGVEYEGSVSLNDSNYEDKTYSVISNPSRGTVTMGANGTFVYTGNSSTCISDEFVYQVCDASNICCAYATVYLDFADVTKPTLQNIPDNDTISCDEVVPLPPQIFALDNCPGISLDVKEVDTQGEDGCSLYDYTITRTWTAIDICGNSTSASQVIEVQDLIAPDIYRVYTLPNGKKMVAGVMELVGGNWKTVSLPIDFDTKPIILHQVTTNDGLTPVVAQIQNVSVSQFELRIAAEEANTTKLTRESVSWVAMEAGVQSTDYQFEMNSLLLSNTPEVATFQNSFATTPALFTSAQTTNEEDPASIRHDLLTTSGVAMKVQEETSNDTESLHLDERVGYLALEKIGDLRDEEGILLGEVGTTSLNGDWKTITLNNTYANPVVIANSLSTNVGEPATVRVQNVGLNSFEVKVEEWAYLDGTHGAETVSYMVVEGSIPLESPTYCDDGTDSLDIGIDFKAVDNCDVSVIINYTEKDTFIDAAKIITRTWSAEDECGNSTSYSQEIICQGVSLQLKSILQGAMLNNSGNGLMRDDLRKKGILPLEEPYTQMPFFEHVSSGGGEVMDANLLAIDGPDGIVDWVFVELRDANDMKNVVATQSALIQCDGDIVTVKGDSIILFSNTRVGDYFVAVRHRNHLGMITLNTESFTPTTTPVVDFTFAFTPVVGSNASIKVDNLESLWSGDLNSDGKVIYQGPNNDIFYMFLHVLQDEGNVDFLPNFISNRYTNDDFNLDGSVIYQGPNNDRAKLLFNTILRHPDNPHKFSNFIIYRGEGGN